MEYQPVDTRFIEAFKRIHREMSKVYHRANLNDLSQYPDTNAAIAREAAEWLHIMDDADENITEELLYGIDFRKSCVGVSGMNPMFAAVQ